MKTSPSASRTGAPSPSPARALRVRASVRAGLKIDGLEAPCVWGDPHVNELLRR